MKTKDKIKNISIWLGGVILLLASIVIFSDKAIGGEIDNNQLHARCAAWSNIAGFKGEQAKGHIIKAAKTMSDEDIMFEVGYAEGLVVGLSVYKGTKDEQALDMYLEHCMKESI
jgi:uncharacterized protein (DUF342 family)